MENDPEFIEFTKALSRLPRPVACFRNGAACPWCGGLNISVTFGQNSCFECGQSYLFGYPDWWNRQDPCSWVPFPHREFDACGRRADLIPEFKPNQRLQEIYFEAAEENLGKRADMERAN